ncbi:replication initiator protein RepSA [Virgisporangium ochraceum]|uniref:Replication initiation protein n=1 Tax=Virgisporangium ochraceum TaxID=65505 RepID=A0A8J3ZZB0_9ACTN|nr:replication initiator [Virgisporangium ochraceum]GIJ71250.1 replication initiation protein [Virgisporangium ochraceum]
MTRSTLDLTPRTPATASAAAPARGVGSNADPATPPRYIPAHSYTVAGQAITRANTGDYGAWLGHIRPAAGCSHPVRLAGTITSTTTDPGGGRVMSTVDTATMPDGVIYKPCGNRRASVCPSCADTYRRDAYHLVLAGLTGGKGVTPAVAKHPALFVTYTAPSFGVVHTQRRGKAGQQLPCRPRRQPDPCPHGVDVRCHRIHADGEKILGQPLCLDCYDHGAQVIWNNQAPELWRRTTIAIRRAISRRCRQLRIPSKLVRLEFGKAAEMQRRGVVHYHAIIRLDGHDPDNADAIVRPPIGIGVLDLVDAVEHATTVRFTTDTHPARPRGWPIRWGDRDKGIDIRPLRLAADDAITDEQVAGYLAKYATKSTEATGHTSRRLTDETIDVYADPDGSHTERLVEACWTLGQPRAWRGLRRWAHMLGFGGHCFTKSRRYSVTFRILRQRRVIHARTETAALDVQHTAETTVVETELAYAGAGWRTHGDALLANTSAAMARARQQAAHDVLTDEINNTRQAIPSAVAA